MIGHLKITSPWKQLALLLLVSTPLLAATLFNSGTEAKIDLTKPGVAERLKWAQVLGSISFFFLPAFLFAAFTFRTRQFYFLGFKKPEKPNMFILSGIIALVAMPAVFWFGQLNQMLPIPESLRQMEIEAGKTMGALQQVKSSLDIFVNLLIIAVVPAICEEIYFRGALQRVLINVTRSPWAGIIISAMLFSALHFQFLGFIPRTYLGIVLGALCWYSGSLWTAVIAHFVINAVQVVAVAYMPKYVNENPHMPMLYAVISLTAVVAIIWYFKRNSNVSWSRVYGVNDLNATNQFIA